MLVRLLTGTALLFALSVSAQCMDKEDLFEGLSDEFHVNSFFDLPLGLAAFEYDTGLEAVPYREDLTSPMLETIPAEAKSETSSESRSPVMEDLLDVEGSPNKFRLLQEGFLNFLESRKVSLWEDAGNSRDDTDLPLEFFEISFSMNEDGFGEPFPYSASELEISDLSDLYGTLPVAQPLQTVVEEQAPVVLEEPLSEEPTTVDVKKLTKPKRSNRKRISTLEAPISETKKSRSTRRKGTTLSLQNQP